MKHLILVLSLVGSFFTSSAFAKTEATSPFAADCKEGCPKTHSTAVGINDPTNPGSIDSYAAYLSSDVKESPEAGAEGNN